MGEMDRGIFLRLWDMVGMSCSHGQTLVVRRPRVISFTAVPTGGRVSLLRGRPGAPPPAWAKSELSSPSGLKWQALSSPAGVSLPGEGPGSMSRQPARRPVRLSAATVFRQEVGKGAGCS